MTLVRNNHTAMYRQIADRLQEEIAAGQFRAGDKLPSEGDLEKRFAVSRVTIRLALKLLTNEGIIERKQGKGTFVSGKRVAHGLHIMRSLHESLRQQGLNATMQLIDKQNVPVPAPLNTIFGQFSSLTMITRLHKVDQEPIALGSSYFSELDEKLSWQQIEQQPTWRLLEQSTGQTIQHSDIRIRLVKSETEQARLLNILPDSPLFRLQRISWFPDGQCAEHSVFYIRPEHYEFTWQSRSS